MNFISEFEAAFKDVSPPLFVRWAAITTVAGALERKVWVRTKKSPLYPNLYVILVAPPGIGKTEMTWRVQSLWSTLEEHHIAHTSVTKASLIDLLYESERKIMTYEPNNPIYRFHSLLVASDELGVLLPAYDNLFMNALTHLYDGKVYSESRRTNKLVVEMERTNLNLFAGCTPAYLKETLPPGAWDQGFLSRVILVYADQQNLKSLFDEEEEDKAAVGALAARLKQIGELYGKFRFTEEAKKLMDHWYLNGRPPVPEHPRLANYNTRRHVHLLKLAMIASAAKADDLIIHEEDIRTALDWLVEAEMEMPEIFKSMASGGDSQIYQETYHFLYQIYMKEQKPVAQFRLIRFLQERTPTHNIIRVIETMAQARMLQEVAEKGVGVCYIPGEFKKTL